MTYQPQKDWLYGETLDVASRKQILLLCDADVLGRAHGRDANSDEYCVVLQVCSQERKHPHAACAHCSRTGFTLVTI